MMRLFSVNPTLPVIAACEICGVKIDVKLSRDTSGHMWISAEELITAWMDHQLIDCKPLNEGEVNDEGTVCG